MANPPCYERMDTSMTKRRNFETDQIVTVCHHGFWIAARSLIEDRDFRFDVLTDWIAWSQPLPAFEGIETTGRGLRIRLPYGLAR